jgi:NitT/TauT family transport system ATP-binding protein
VPVFYRILSPGIPQPKAAAEREAEVRAFVEPLPDVPSHDIVSLLEHLEKRDGQLEIFRIADEMNREFSRVISIVKAAEMLDYIDTPGQLVVMTQVGNQFIKASPEERKVIWRQQLLTLRLFREIYDVCLSQPDRSVDREFILETIVTRMPYENYESIFNTFVRWARFGRLFVYDEAKQRVSILGN